jgi:putative aldouronate transport system substrate-binding protein
MKVMKMRKRILAVLLAGLMTAGMAACGSSETSSAGTEGSSSTGGESSTAEASETSQADNEEVVTLVVWGQGSADTEDVNEVAEAVSEITRDAIGVEINFVRGQDGEQVNLALTSGEQIDLLNYNPVSGGLPSLVRNTYATPLDDLVEEYGQGALELIDPIDLESCRIGGVLYSLPNMRDTTWSVGFGYRQDILDELGLEVGETTTFEEFHDILVKVHEAYPDMYPMVPSWAGGGMQIPMAYDPLGDTLGVLENAFDSSTEVVNLYATETYRTFCEMMYQWNQEGLVMPDATTTTENNLLSANGFAIFSNIKPGIEGELSRQNNKDIKVSTVIEPYKHTGVAQGNNFIIPYCAAYPEKAMQLWNLMYTDAEVSNLFVNGIEGKHWAYANEEKTLITTPEGVDSSATGYPVCDWAMPNQQITTPWVGNPEDLWDQLNEFNKSGVASPAQGFTWDSTSMINEITACNNVVSQYDVALRWGTLDPNEALSKFNADLEAAGINDIIAEKQRQLDEYLAAKE